jgi:alanine racemase
MIPAHIPRVEISLDNLIHNLSQIRKRLARKDAIIAVVKDNAYGCGAGVISRALEQDGVNFFAVFSMAEASQLRAFHISSPILILGEAAADEIRWASSQNVRLTVNDMASLKKIAAAPCRSIVHVNINTGMNRLGLFPHEAGECAGYISAHADIELEGVFTHLANADIPQTATVSKQYDRFSEALRAFRGAGFSPKYIHVPNSAGLLRFGVPDEYCVRPGIILYGCKPDPAQEFPIDLRPVAALKAGIIKIMSVPAQTPVSYGGTYVTPRDTRIATAPLGYAHGLPRALSNKGEVLIGGRRFPIVGRVTMDYIMIDIQDDTDISCGDEVVALGSQGNETITADAIALQSNTIAYEILCGLNARINRFYLQGGRIIYSNDTLGNTQP